MIIIPDFDFQLICTYLTPSMYIISSTDCSVTFWFFPMLGSLSSSESSLITSHSEVPFDITRDIGVVREPVTSADFPVNDLEVIQHLKGD